MNDLVLLPEDGYDAQGTAALVVRCLKETLGLTLTSLASILKHFR
jgi:hypothetical protein